MNTIIDSALSAQQKATNVNSSIWVTASAGTGKTKVLTDRVLALLVMGNEVTRIMCLTFTRAASAEMKQRVIDQLGRWSVMKKTELRLSLSKLLGHRPNQQQIEKAKHLFTMILDTPGGINIETIHAFCQSLLRRFPLEADISPHFALMDEGDANEIILQAKEETLLIARSGKNKKLTQSLETITNHLHENSFPNFLNTIISSKSRLSKLLSENGGVDKIVRKLCSYVGIKREDTSAKVTSNILKINPVTKPKLELAVEILSQGSNQEIRRASKIKTWLNLENKTLEDFEIYADAFITSGYRIGQIKIRKTLLTKKLSKDFPNTAKHLQAEAARIAENLLRIRTALMIETTEAMLVFSNTLLISYKNQKEQLALIDYDDLISKTNVLLRTPGISPWILYKLDGGIDHILIDEAQDTNPEQWQIIESLVEEFFSGVGSETTQRTIFTVGDIKQSIYSFQGADPEAFENIKNTFSNKITNAGKKWKEHNLDISFRSTPAVLNLIDSVFSSKSANDGVIFDKNSIQHQAARNGEGGLAELWPLLETNETSPLRAWKPPIDRIKSEPSSSRLAQIISEKIHWMLSSGEILLSKNRPIRAGDILILVRQRSRLVDDLVKALKVLNIDVAGVDKMILTEHISIMDLISLGRFTLLPEDDLNLATLLKSPLIGFSEEDLFEISYDRKISIWSELKLRKSFNANFSRAYEFLIGVIAEANQITPFEFYTSILDIKGGRTKIIGRLGHEANDPISEFLNLAISYERSRVPSLEGFLYWLESGEVEIKRDLEQTNSNSVRIMTVHGAKGLQAPIVFLPDTTQKPKKLDPFLWLKDKNGSDVSPLWPPRRENFDNVAEEERTKAEIKRDQEYRRLLYVAMTRAQDRLYICGWSSGKPVADDCWYNLIKNAITKIGTTVIDPFLSKYHKVDDTSVFRVTSNQTKPVKEKQIAPYQSKKSLGTWAFTPVKKEQKQTHASVTSTILGEIKQKAPLETLNNKMFKKGIIIHNLMQNLPNLPSNARQSAAKNYLKLPKHNLSSHLQAKIFMETFKILDNPKFNILFNSLSRAEVPIVGKIGGKTITGQIDRLVVEKKCVTILDFKTNENPPTNISGVPKEYIDQMSLYKTILNDIYPNHNIECVLLWTVGPKLMKLDINNSKNHST